MLNSRKTRAGWTALAAAVAAFGTVSGASAADVTVHRGAIAGALAGHATDTRFGVTEIRGVPDQPAPTPAVASAASANPVIATAGNRLWIFDSQTRTVTVCRHRKTFHVGTYNVTCEKHSPDF